MIKYNNISNNIPAMQTYRDAVRYGARVLANAHIDNADYDALELLLYITGIDRTRYLIDATRQLDDVSLKRYLEVVTKRAHHVPLQHIMGYTYFYGRKYMVNEHVLIPRQDTEILVSEVIKVAKDGYDILDMCTGSGCIGITLAKKFPDSNVTGVDISDKALAVAWKNKCNLDADNIDFIQSDLFAALGADRRYDIIVSNPPYIPTKVIEGLQDEVRLHDPMLALDGTEDGLMFYRRITDKSGDYLKMNGYLCYEIGAEQAADVSDIMKQAGFKDIVVVKDLAGLDRVVMGKK